METFAFNLPLEKTNIVSTLIKDYLLENSQLQAYYSLTFSKENFQKKLQLKKKFKHRELLVNYFYRHYNSIGLSEAQQKNIQELTKETSYTVCTAHQPNIFGGPLFTIYKILQCIKTAQENSTPTNPLIPIFFMGSEDADFEELSFIQTEKQKIQWNTLQRGVFGKLKNEGFAEMIALIESEIKHFPFSSQILEIIKNAYNKNLTIQESTFIFYNKLFAEYGLLILSPDDKMLKTAFLDIIKKDVLDQTSQPILEQTIFELKKQYSIQAHPREINFFYFHENQRCKIVFEKNIYSIQNTTLTFTREALEKEIENYPEKFSPNVFLRALMQEFLLPNLIFIGGGGEIAYWLEMKKMFEEYQVDFPILTVRNSFVFLTQAHLYSKAVQNNWTNNLHSLFLSEEEWLKRLSIDFLEKEKKIRLQDWQEELFALYKKIENQTHLLSPTLSPHIQSLKQQHLKKINAVYSKLIRHQKKQFETVNRQRQSIVNSMFPENVFQERLYNFIPFYAQYGKQFFKTILDNMNTEQAQVNVIFIYSNHS